MFCMLKKENIYPPYVSKYSSNRGKQVILIMIPNGEGWNCLAVKKLSAILRRITSSHHGDFYCLICLHSFTTEENVNLIKAMSKPRFF